MTASRANPSRAGASGPTELAELTHHRWALPILAALHERGGGAKFITLLKALDLPRDSLSRTLAALIDLGLVQRNPGYGHPMRPEYLLSRPGIKVATAAEAVLRAADTSGHSKLLLKKWSLPVIAAIDSGDRRFSDLRRALPAITPRALTASLKQLAAHELIERTVWDDSPPTVEYGLSATGRGLVEPLRALDAAL